MAPLILHNVPDDELYVGDDGVRRPYAMVYPQQETTRNRRTATETGSFGKSTRRSRSRTGTPAARRENPTSTAADKLFGDWVNNKAATSISTTTTAAASGVAPQRKSSGQNLLSQAQADESAPAAAQRTLLKAEPSEVILRGYRSSLHQYSAVNHYEHIAGYICEDYPREPPAELRRYKGDLREPAFTRRRPLTQEEKVKVNRADGGDYWVKVTFESAEAADAAVYASPQSIQGYLVHAEHYRGFAPVKDEPIPDVDNYGYHEEHHRSQSVPGGPAFGTSTPLRRRAGSRATGLHRTLSDASPPNSLASSRTLDTAISQTASSGTITDAVPSGLGTPGRGLASSHDAAAPATPGQPQDSVFCSKIPTARRATIRPAEEAHLPSQSLTARFLAAVPILMWLMGGFGAMIGNEVPRKEDGEFDHDRASLYWKFIWWLDATFGLFRGEVMSAADKDD